MKFKTKDDLRRAITYDIVRVLTDGATRDPAPELNTDEANALREKMTPEIKGALDKGYCVEFPPEIPDASDEW